MSLKLESYKNLPVCKRRPKMFKNSKKTEYIEYHAENLVQDSHINYAHHLVFKLLDKMAPSLQKHSKIAKALLYISEKFIKSSGNIK